MICIALLLTLFAAIALLSFFDERKDKYVVSIYVTAVFLMVLIAAFKPLGLDRDSGGYYDYFYAPPDYTLEPTFLLIADLARSVFQSFQFIFIAYALLSIPLKAYAITRLTDLWFMSLLIWMSNFYIFHDLTQIRVAVSVAFFLFGLYDLSKGRRLRYCAYILAATLFHYSAVALFPLCLLGCKPLNRVWKWILYAVPLVGLSFAALHVDPLTLLPIPYIQERMDLYEKGKEMMANMVDDINVFNPVYLLRVAIYYVLLIKSRLLTEHVPHFPLLIKILALSVFSFTFLSAIPAIAYRFRELFGVVEILLIPYMCYIVKPQWVGKAVVLLYASVVLLLNIFYNQLLMPV